MASIYRCATSTTSHGPRLFDHLRRKSARSLGARDKTDRPVSVRGPGPGLLSRVGKEELPVWATSSIRAQAQMPDVFQTAERQTDIVAR